ncbi:TolC family protein [Rhodanobacter sp. AS-Z3]|uniref:TolC family protein n=1 Tax=Rhodanobacter sp. AS-Z3 TaxID=3031330 RepID=UPI00247AA286|nr:TolC family protein [Rhodanobacter sp. AS-Z3]WEN14896.1 TolC family protein [Rhodanobacter sp. AS-Z3]
MPSLRCIGFLLLAGSFATPVAYGQALSLSQAVQRSLTTNAALRAANQTIIGTERRAELTGLAPAWTVGADIENAGGTGPYAGLQGSETTLRLGRVIELGGKLDARRAVGAAEVARSRLGLDQTRLTLATETTMRFVEVLADQARIEVAARDLALARELTATVAHWVTVGRSPESDLALMQIRQEQADIEVEHAEHELAAARVSLAALWGAEEADFAAASGDLFTLPAVPAFEQFVARLADNPAQRALVLDARTSQARERLASAMSRPDITAHVGVRRMGISHDTALIAGVTIPLGSARRSALSAAQAQAETNALQAQAEASATERRQQLFTVYQELLHARTAFEAHRDRMIPKAESALALTRKGFAAGRFSFVSLAQAQRTLLDLRTAQIDAALRYHTLLAEIERMTATTGVTP